MNTLAKNILLGESLEQNVKFLMTNMGFSVEEHKITEPGTDVIARLESKEIHIECLNWNKNSYINSDRLNSLVNNLTRNPNAIKVILTTFNACSPFIHYFRTLGIHVVSIGQLITKVSAKEQNIIKRVLYNSLFNSLSLLSGIVIRSKIRGMRGNRGKKGQVSKEKEVFSLEGYQDKKETCFSSLSKKERSIGDIEYCSLPTNKIDKGKGNRMEENLRNHSVPLEVSFVSNDKTQTSSIGGVSV